jgi:hypothetical protein
VCCVLQAYYAQAEQIEELKRSATFPKLTPPSPDFLGMMEEYVQQAPRGGGAAVRSRPSALPRLLLQMAASPVCNWAVHLVILVAW